MIILTVNGYLEWLFAKPAPTGSGLNEVLEKSLFCHFFLERNQSPGTLPAKIAPSSRRTSKYHYANLAAAQP